MCTCSRSTIDFQERFILLVHHLFVSTETNCTDVVTERVSLTEYKNMSSPRRPPITNVSWRRWQFHAIDVWMNYVAKQRNHACPVHDQQSSVSSSCEKVEQMADLYKSEGRSVGTSSMSQNDWWPFSGSAKSYIQVFTEVVAYTWIFIGVPLLWYALLSADIGVLQVLDSCLESSLIVHV